MQLATVEYRLPEPPPPASNADWIARRNAVGLREMVVIAEQWQLTQEQLSRLLGTASRTLLRWRKQADDSGQLDLSGDTVERMSYLLGISKALQILLPTPANRLLWLRNPNSGPPFNGQVPLDRLLNGQVADLFVVRQVLDAARD